MVLFLGCNEKKYPYSYAPIDRPVSANLLTDTSGKLVRERWWLHELGDAKLGRRWWREFEVERDGQTYRRHVIIDELQIPRFGTPVRQTFRWSSVTDADGRLREFAYSSNNGRRRLAAAVKRDRLIITDTTDKSSRTTRQEWEPATWAYPQLVDYLRQQRYPPGTHVAAHCFVPLSDALANLAVEVSRLESAPEGVIQLASQLDLARLMVRVYASASAAMAGTDPLVVLWLDDDYEVLRESRPQIGYETTPCDELAAAAPNSTPDLDVATQTFVKVDDSAAGNVSQLATYTVSSATLEPSQVFESGSYQEVRRLADRTAEIRVSAAISGSDDEQLDALELRIPQPPRQGTDAATVEPNREDAQPNRFVNFEHPEVRQLAQSAAGRLREPAALAESLRQLVYRRLDKSYEIVGLPTASSVITAGKADCNGHAVLLAALCRARGLPARVVVGLRREGPTMYFHMWTEAWYDRAWHPLDASSADGFTTDYLKIRSHNLAGDYAVALLAPVLKIANHIQIEIR